MSIITGRCGSYITSMKFSSVNLSALNVDEYRTNFEGDAKGDSSLLHNRREVRGRLARHNMKR
jgi:hypothetical protein